ncbi:tRNA pseudouridine(55) synthase TruB [Ruminococcus sp. AM29-19LB]|nr:tRNA pseudouridine(55) synthase TruB [Ruminococcus sp. AF19-4LB]RGH72469.1 tRNA pseudouridine(55) synthase TruB [Ruminococcus sp. AM29-5AC]RGH76297.1 tRNA pseudouridine(55) synthase TruB [Ruminococcus sp. AM29-1LB]RGH78369.1 tRNA pseudouridine(55) synthase TruB [Ruminococcus sp. AM29-19LB]RGH81231.1 tRNA pseudouridine(55) synthase TruB [Ruminococcus sp. AM29-10LB]RGH84547.1 tRNA pseudouridine(55) synthase TruB [Ruminococcus sp. AM29-1]
MINGIVNIYKEKGYTSHDVVAVLRKVVGQKKIGHTGTLDPDATGVLPVCLGRATKVCELLTDHDKTYEALLLLGKTTDTQDISGEVLEERDPGDLTEEEVRSYIESFIGEYDQIPPMYSALKVNGKKLYELAREGKTVERKSRKVQIHGIRILEMNLPHVRMEVDCSKGTYIRTLCHDIGEKLQVGGCMEELERTKVGRFLKEDAVTLDEVRQKMEQGEGAELFTPLDQIFAELPAVTVTDAKAWMSYNGNDLPERFLLEKEAWTDGQEVRVYDSRKNFIGLYQYRAPKKLFHIKKMFLDPEAEKIEK